VPRARSRHASRRSIAFSNSERSGDGIA
jgi:hypothetical protein